MPIDHEASEEFLAHLEWQTRTALRRQQRFATRAAAAPGRWLRTAALVVGCTVGGAGLVVAAEHVQEARQRDDLAARNALQIELQAKRVSTARRELERRRTLFEVGRLDARGMLEPSLALNAAELELRHLELARDEIEATGRAPDRGIDAALVGEVDFVAKHIECDLLAAAKRIPELRANAERLEVLHQSGRLSVRATLPAGQALSEAEAERDWLLSVLRIRLTYALGRMPAGEAVLREQIAEAEYEYEIAAQERAVVRHMAERNQAQIAAGVLPAGTFPTPDDVEILELEAELKRQYVEELRAELTAETELSPLPEEYEKLSGRDRR